MVLVDVWNVAVGMVRGRPVSASSESSMSADACRLYWELCARQVLSTVPWTFATQWRTLPQHLTETAPQGRYALALPSDTVKVWDARRPHWPLLSEDVDPSIHFEISQRGEHARVVIADTPDAEFQITTYVDVGLWSASAIRAAAALLAANIAIPLAGVADGRFLRREYEESFQQEIDRAQTEDLGPRRLSRGDCKYISGRR